MRWPEPPLLLITNRTMARYPLCDVVTAAVVHGCRWVMIREKDLSDAALTALVQAILNRTRTYGARISINGRAAVAAVCGAHGVHLPQGYDVQEVRHTLGAEACLGVSAHSLPEAQSAAEEGADYVTFSPIFLTASKPGYGPALGLEELHRASTAIPIPIVVLGGVTPQNAGECLRAGAAGVAIMGSVMGAEEPGKAVEALVRSLAECRERRR